MKMKWTSATENSEKINVIFSPGLLEVKHWCKMDLNIVVYTCESVWKHSLPTYLPTYSSTLITLTYLLC